MLKSSCRSLTLATIALSVFAVLPATGQTINEDLKFTASDGAAGDRFGFSIAIDNGIVAVGAHRDRDNGGGSGSAYLFHASTGAQLFKLLPDDGATGDSFGRSIDIDNGIVAVGAILNDDIGGNSGSAYLFDASTGVQLHLLLANDGMASDWLGISIAIDDGVVAVGANQEHLGGIGSAYLFDVLSGEQLFKLLPNDGTAGDLFGSSVDIGNGIVAVGSPEDSDNGSSSGSVYLFDASTGSQVFKLLPNDGGAYDRFGFSVAVHNNILAVGARFGSNDGSPSGSVYLFNTTTGVQIAKLVPNDGAASDQFGYSIDINNGIVAVGAILDDDNNKSSGSAYLFDASTGKQIAKLLPSDGGMRDQFGRSIALSNGMITVGAFEDDDNGTDSGSAYLFTLPCPADLTGDGFLDFFDISAFLQAFSATDPIADFTGEGIFDFFDVSAFLQAFNAGCP